MGYIQHQDKTLQDIGLPVPYKPVMYILKLLLLGACFFGNHGKPTKTSESEEAGKFKYLFSDSVLNFTTVCRPTAYI